jgi:hypothetical protein
MGTILRTIRQGLIQRRIIRKLYNTESMLKAIKCGQISI